MILVVAIVVFATFSGIAIKVEQRRIDNIESSAQIAVNNQPYNKDVMSSKIAVVWILLIFMAVMLSSSILKNFSGKRAMQMLELLIGDLAHPFLLLVIVPTSIYVKNSRLRKYFLELLLDNLIW